MTLMRALESLSMTNIRLLVGKQYISALALAALVALGSGNLLHAASINYGTFNLPADGITYQNVTESSGTDGVPLYGPPDPFSIGLDFDPANFVSTSSGGTPDVTDGQLNFAILGLSNPSGSVGVSSVKLFEAGDYTLAGAGGLGTSVSAGAIMRATVTQINGVAVAPINLTPVNASFSDSLPGAVVVAPWSLGVTLDVAAQLAGLGFGPDEVATKVEISVNNALVSTSEVNSLSFIAKKEFQIDLTPDTVGDPFIPEPSTLVLTSLVLGLASMRGRLR
jgi:hypothetical protein